MKQIIAKIDQRIEDIGLSFGRLQLLWIKDMLEEWCKQKVKELSDHPETPRCRVCGKPLSVQGTALGQWSMGCDGLKEGDKYEFEKGRSIADKHYSESRIYFTSSEQANAYGLSQVIFKMRRELGDNV